MSLVLRVLMIERENFNLISDVILVDNNSTDNSILIAKQFDVEVSSCDGNVAKVRNFGAAIAQGEFLCFVDSDVQVMSGWSKAIADLIEEAGEARHNLVCGNVYGIPTNATWVERVWYKSLVNRKRAKYINGGNFAISSQLFRTLAGFDETLIWYEEVDLCKRAARLGGAIRIDDRIQTIHYGYPKNLSSFFRRERRLGIGAIDNKLQVHSSKSLLLAAATFFFPILLAIALLASIELAVALVIIAFGASYLACSIRLRQYFSAQPLKLALLFAVYGVARLQAMIDRARPTVTVTQR